MNRRDAIKGMTAAGTLAVLPGVAAAAKVKPRLFFQGANFGYLARQGYFSSSAGIAAADALAATGMQWVSLIVMVMQDAFYSTRVYKDFQFTQSDVELTAMIARFRKRGIKVLLKPMIDVNDSSWRGRIGFPTNDQQIQGVTTDYWTPWFRSMTQAMLFYARMAQATGAEGFTIAQELYGTDTQTEHWLDTLAQVRKVYSGPVCVNADGRSNLADPAVLGWMGKCDALGISMYPNLDIPDRPTREQVSASLEPQRRRVAAAHEATGLPVYFAEFGARSVRGALKSTGDYRNVAPYDGEIQALYLDTLLDTFWKVPGFGGFQYWKWDEQQQRPQYVQPDGDAGFTVQGKPAEKVIAKWGRMPPPAVTI